jgi:hypothetical protein
MGFHGVQLSSLVAVEYIAIGVLVQPVFKTFVVFVVTSNFHPHSSSPPRGRDSPKDIPARFVLLTP